MASTICLPYLGPYHPREARDLAFADITAQFISHHGIRAFGRDARIGHVTASAFVLSPDRQRVLLMHHAKLGRWLQMGGHCDGSPDVRSVALREAREETGLSTIEILSGEIVDIDIHEIPARGDEPAHLHHDIRFLMRADDTEEIVRNLESHDLRWVPISRIEDYTKQRSILILRDRMKEIA